MPGAPPPSRGTARLALCHLVVAVAIPGCGDPDSGTPPLPRETWVDRPVAEWPDFALSNEVVFEDTAFAYTANAFAIDTGADTVGVTCKHMFMVFRNQRGTTSIALDDSFRSWSFLSSRDSTRVLRTRRLINADPAEPIGDFASIKDRDWIIFELDGWSEGIYPLKVRFSPLEPGETVHAVGRSLDGRHDPDPVPSPLQVFRAASTYYYVRPLDPAVDAVQTSGSPVIDADGYLVGLVSGAVGNLGVVAGVGYLKRQLDLHGIPYRDPGP